VDKGSPTALELKKAVSDNAMSVRLLYRPNWSPPWSQAGFRAIHRPSRERVWYPGSVKLNMSRHVKKGGRRRG